MLHASFRDIILQENTRKAVIRVKKMLCIDFKRVCSGKKACYKLFYDHLAFRMQKLRKRRVKAQKMQDES